MVAAFGLLGSLVLVAPALAAPAADVLAVTHYSDDDAQGSLRWAIETANRNPGHYRIEIEAVGKPPYVIRPQSPLPEIKGPVQIVGLPRDRDGAYIAIDGSAYVVGDGVKACPGAVPGQYGTNVRTMTSPGLVLRDTEGVELSGLEIRNFCIGVLINRASGNYLHDNRIVGNRGGSGVMLTGDDGHGKPTATTTVHNRIERNEFLDNGDGLELTRGAAFNLVAENRFVSTDANPEPSQGIEILWGNDNFVLRNLFEHYSDGLQINWGNRNTIAANTFTGNAVGVNVSGDGNIVDGNTITGNSIGIGVRPEAQHTSNRFTKNAIYGNGLKINRCFAGGVCDPSIPRVGILFGLPGLEHWVFKGNRGGGVVADPAKAIYICPDHAPNCQPMPNGGIAPPQLDAGHWTSQRLQLSGHLRGAAHRRFHVELFANRPVPAGAIAEGEMYLGSVDAYSDAQGRARFEFDADNAHPLGTAGDAIAVTATVTASDGATSEFSSALTLHRQ
ncbi:3-dehydroshikimate dehydratase [Solimonas sp. C16B3]|uniref:3-dehydroshikimate dehydratase n=2 Tax=Solimonas marina TaxID=2714601 RepID=A0A969WE92_9GAMM|nr:3-dehydroshikimate dehydratase [Solimonas marina]